MTFTPALAVVPAFRQFKPKASLPAAATFITFDPLVPTDPDQAPVALQEVAAFEDHVRVVDAPARMAIGEASMIEVTGPFKRNETSVFCANIEKVSEIVLFDPKIVGNGRPEPAHEWNTTETLLKTKVSFAGSVALPIGPRVVIGVESVNTMFSKVMCE